jgi:putative endonuclease
MPPWLLKPKARSKPKNERGQKGRRDAEIYGRRGEALAAWYLRLKGYRIIESRYKTPLGEIDLIARRFGTTVFVEVKSRKSRHLEGEALLSIRTDRIVRAADYYISRHPSLVATPLRYDVIFLAPRMWPRHVMNAFDAG